MCHVHALLDHLHNFHGVMVAVGKKEGDFNYCDSQMELPIHR